MVVVSLHPAMIRAFLYRPELIPGSSSVTVKVHGYWDNVAIFGPLWIYTFCVLRVRQETARVDTRISGHRPMRFSYFISNTWAMVLIGTALALAPWLIRL